MPHSKQNRSFRDVLSGQALGLVLKKLNLTQEKQTTQEQKKWQKHTTSKPISKENLNKQSILRTVYVNAYHCAQQSYTVQHRTVL